MHARWKEADAATRLTVREFGTAIAAYCRRPFDCNQRTGGCNLNAELKDAAWQGGKSMSGTATAAHICGGSDRLYIYIYMSGRRHRLYSTSGRRHRCSIRA